MNYDDLLQEADTEKRYVDTDIIKSFARASVYILKNYDVSISDYIRCVTKTKTFDEFPDDYTLYGRSSGDIARHLVKAMEENGCMPRGEDEWQKEDADYNEDVMFWVAYVFAYWNMAYKPDISEYQKCNFEKIVSFYDIMHTQSCDYVIASIIKKDHFRA